MASITQTLLSRQQVAERLGVSLATVARLLTSGALGAYRVGRQWRISLTSLDAYLQRPASK